MSRKRSFSQRLQRLVGFALQPGLQAFCRWRYVMIKRQIIAL